MYISLDNSCTDTEFHCAHTENILAIKNENENENEF